MERRMIDQSIFAVMEEAVLRRAEAHRFKGEEAERVAGNMMRNYLTLPPLPTSSGSQVASSSNQ
ncbi:hypothetical protein HYFRA_00006840 [Hymenoscyphus fraxineus]|uniref:Uncharacterized protein n=1 Tax=Hymenoscyphus fraxineus TaxID=746836 RepID=A0A9N9PQD6_9HELO|nr:hypothetical protein HYFRA_00006840 [Hymenoscyphus fraxineus]